MASEGKKMIEAQALADHKQLLEHCGFARRAEALALLDLQPGLLNLGWGSNNAGKILSRHCLCAFSLYDCVRRQHSTTEAAE